MGMYAPMVRRDVFLACFDPLHRVALVRPGPAGANRSWTLPAVRRRNGELHAGAARRLAAAVAPSAAVRFGRVTGRVEAPRSAGADPPSRWVVSVSTAHVSPASALRPAPGVADLCWFPHLQVAYLVEHLGIPDLGAFLEGYVDGWIPDGQITLC